METNTLKTNNFSSSPPEENVHVRLTGIEMSDNSDRKRTSDRSKITRNIKFGLQRSHAGMESSQAKQ